MMGNNGNNPLFPLLLPTILKVPAFFPSSSFFRLPSFAGSRRLKRRRGKNEQWLLSMKRRCGKKTEMKRRQRRRRQPKKCNMQNKNDFVVFTQKVGLFFFFKKKEILTACVLGLCRNKVVPTKIPFMHSRYFRRTVLIFCAKLPIVHSTSFEIKFSRHNPRQPQGQELLLLVGVRAHQGPQGDLVPGQKHLQEALHGHDLARFDYFLSRGKCECATLTTSAETEEESKYLQDKLIEGGKRWKYKNNRIHKFHKQKR